MNALLKHLWPYENYGVGAMVAKQAKQPIEDVIKKVGHHCNMYHRNGKLPKR
jgi:hypothetical protein